mmetsp:Transcript_85047/g.134358  ORF Transcript_85047/g.134358 Transcript_85047/m.134358 type:complete len:116 (+) Transcript_85047:66-413(+)|eukprot:CAMPEP_0169079194 /NCGR_PEP_ID=MMETSP1015-20121227/9816_1 /TAXON_ID=342587 /ORGANISM="Karlodinium micrum, Strain CCMP2283" /LENGTH=115 /DNA_ID=CAMNT_0009138837 /DNA_START=66 /DNA_END=413 /DNA_ORIENTATION=-
MDPILTANLKASAIGESDKRKKWRSFEQEKLRAERRKRGSLYVFDRMDADAAAKTAFSQVCALRANSVHRVALDRAIDKIRPAPELKGPRIVTHNSKVLYQGHGKPVEWAPLEFY